MCILNCVLAHLSARCRRRHRQHSFVVCRHSTCCCSSPHSARVRECATIIALVFFTRPHSPSSHAIVASMWNTVQLCNHFAARASERHTRRLISVNRTDPGALRVFYARSNTGRWHTGSSAHRTARAACLGQRVHVVHMRSVVVHSTYR